MTGESVLIAGGGLVGLFSAHYLLEAGHLVTVVDRAAAGSGAARVNGGWLCPARSDPMASPAMVCDGIRSMLTPHSCGLVLRPKDLPSVFRFLIRFLRSAQWSTYAAGWDALDGLNRRTAGLVDALAFAGLVPGLQDEGFLILHERRAAAEAAHAVLTRTSRRGLAPAPEPVLPRSALLELEPGLGPAARFGFVHRGDRWVDPSQLVDTLVESLAKRGVAFLTGRAVTAVRQDGERVVAATSAGEVEASYAVLACGAWSDPLLGSVGLRGMVTPGWGYSLSVRPDHVPTHVLRLGDTHVGVTPMGDHARLVGIVELGAMGDYLDRRVADLVRAARPWLGGLDWSGVTDAGVAARPMTPDGLPLVGRVPGMDRVVVATGHNMLGLSLGPATGSLVAELVSHPGRSAPAALDPARFNRR